MSPPEAGPATSPTRVSPDNLDSVVLVTDSRSWIAIAVGVLAVGALLVWGLFGTIPERTSVGAVMARDGAIVNAVAPTAGSISEVIVRAGERVEMGQDIVTLLDSDGDTRSVTSATDGVVQAMAVNVGDEVAAGTRVATIVDEQADGALTAVSYVNAAEALAFDGVETVTVSPVTADAGTYGTLEGQVAFIAQVPASTDDIAAQVRNDALATQLSERVSGAPYLIVVEFGDPPEWTGTAPPFPIAEGTLAELSAITSREAPIDKLLD
ncbi:MAG: HlyD family efflux transporter periplasmic adaptor subunit [Actinomycetota bacterium]